MSPNRAGSFFPGRLAAVLALVCLGAGAPAAAGPRTTAEGVYTEAQARKGLEVHQQYCAKCHHHSYFQGGFLLAWQSQPVAALYDLIEMKMPEDRPGALKPREYAALLAYVFELNGLPAGEAKLSHDHDEMANILIAR